MGGFSSRGGNAQNQQVQEVTVPPKAKAQHHQEPAVASERPIVNQGSSKPRPDIGQTAPQSISSSDHRQPSSGVSRVGAAGDRSGQRAARPKNGPGNGSLRITSGDQHEDWGEVLAEGMEEEEMQRAIEASIMESSHHRAASVPIDRHNSHLSAQARNIAAAHQNSDNAEEGGDRAAHPRGRQAGPTKAAQLSLNVDNSEFQHGTGSSAAGSQARTRGRSEPASIRGGIVSSGGAGSGIVTLPRIAQPVPASQQEMVKDLHESIAGTMGEHGDNPHGEPQKGHKGKHRGVDHQNNGHSRPKGGSVDVRSLMEDNDDLGDMSLSQIKYGSRNQEKFNDQYHSCGGDRSGAQSSGFR